MTEITVSKTFTFEASHILPNHPGKCARLHGHSWVLVVSVKGQIRPSTGFVVDFYDVSKMVQQNIIDQLDHSHLGAGTVYTYERPGVQTSMSVPYLGPNFYPTSENLCHAIAKILQPLVKELSSHARLYAIEIRETCTSSARWCADDTPSFPGDDIHWDSIHPPTR